MSAHTPRPWSEFRDADSHDIIGPDGLHIATMEPRNSRTPAADQDADARLIAAAPDLLAAVEHVLEASEDGGTFNDVDFTMLRAALAKAVRS
jgi:hypothetical protein